jgi:hypothetical protein
VSSYIQKYSYTGKKIYGEPTIQTTDTRKYGNTYKLRNMSHYGYRGTGKCIHLINNTFYIQNLPREVRRFIPTSDKYERIFIKY